MTLNGQVFALRMPAHRTTVSVSLSSPTLPTPATSEPGFTVTPVDKNGKPTNNPNERWYDPQTGRLIQKGVVQALRFGMEEIPEQSLLRSPKASEGSGGALGEAEALRRGNTVGVRDQVMDLVASQGLKVSRQADNLLPTVTASLVASGGSSSPNWKRNRGSQVTLKDEIEKGDDVKNLTLLPTPNTMDHLPARSAEKIAESKKRTPGGYANIRETVINDLLPTVIASEGTKQDTTVTVQERIDTGHQVHLTHIARSGVDDPIIWGKFAPAIERWEVMIGRPAPAPTKPDGKENAHRLSSEFTEWMMGLPAGWITGVGLSRNEELKACGNGVVPQQAELALRMLLEGLPVERERERTVMLPTPTVSDIYTGDLASTQQKPGSMHSVTLPQAVRMVDGVE
jgi:hypothetical protein